VSIDTLAALVLGTSALWCVIGTYWFWIAGRIPALPNWTGPNSDTKLSIIVTACNEAETIGPALTSLLSVSYRPIEIVIVNDRSTDETGPIIDALIRDHSHARVVHNDHLPEGWLGKVHALHLGVMASSGEWLLFTDADVVYSEGVIADAVNHVESKALDHFSLLPTIHANGWLLNLAVYAFAQLGIHKVFGLFPMPFGAGAFNMVRREALDKSAGLEWLKMEVADDTGLALLITESGGQTAVSTALDGLHLSWYPTLRAMFHGLEKNAGLLISRGRPWRLFAIWLTGALLVTLPFLGTALQPDLWPALTLGMGTYVLATLRLRIRLSNRPWLSLFAPVGFMLLGTCGLWSMIQIMRRGGIDWRGTFYPWKDLVDGQRVKI